MDFSRATKKGKKCDLFQSYRDCPPKWGLKLGVPTNCCAMNQLLWTLNEWTNGRMNCWVVNFTVGGVLLLARHCRSLEKSFPFITLHFTDEWISYPTCDLQWLTKSHVSSLESRDLYVYHLHQSEVQSLEPVTWHQVYDTCWCIPG